MKLSVKLGNFSKQHGRAMILNLRFAASRFQWQGSMLNNCLSYRYFLMKSVYRYIRFEVNLIKTLMHK